MVVEAKIIERYINGRGYFDIKTLFENAKNALDSFGYTFIETEQANKPGVYGKRIVLKFGGEKKINEFVKFNVKIELALNNINKIKHDGKTYDDGDMILKLKGFLIYDYENKWVKSKFLKELLSFYLKYIVKRKFELIYAEPLWLEVDSIYGVIKTDLNLY